MSGAHVIVFVGASGGAGASCLVAATAMHLATTGMRVGCLDRDPVGGGLDVVFGLDHVRGVRWPALLGARGELEPALLLPELPRDRDVWVVSHSRDGLVTVPAEADSSVLAALVSGTDVVLIDGGRPTPVGIRGGAGAGDVAGAARAERLPDAVIDIPAIDGADDVVLVVDATPQSLAAATAIVADVPDQGAPWWLAQRTPRGFAHLPETVQAVLGLPLAATVGSDPKLAATLLDGIPPGARGPMAKAAEQIAGTLMTRARSAA